MTEVAPVTARNLPPLTDDNRAFLQGGREGRLMVGRCPGCGRWALPPHTVCPDCGQGLLAVAASGRARLLTWTTNSHPYHPDLPVPYLIAVVVLVEQDDLRLATNLIGCTEADIRPGMELAVAFENHGESFYPVFRPVDAADGATGSATTPRLPEAAEATPTAGIDRAAVGGGRMASGKARPAAAPERGAVISGIGMSRIGRRTGQAHADMTMAAVREAIADAGLAPGDIDGVASLGDTPPAEVARALGIEPRFHGGGVDDGGLLAPVMASAVAIGEQRARHVVVYRTVQMLGGGMAPTEGAQRPAGDALAALGRVMVDAGDLLAANAFSAANWLALTARRHMDLYGTTKEQLGWLAVNSRRNAGLNPAAVYRDPITMDDYLAARPVSSPFGLLDCDVPVDGSIAFVLSSAAYGPDAPHRAPRLEAIGVSPGTGGWFHRPDYPRMASWDAAADLWSRTELRPGDVQMAQLYDGFTFLTLAWLEALGLCGEGESGPFVEGASRICLTGELPLNTYGGQLSAGRMHGYWVLHEACLQMRGQAGDRQVPRTPEVAVVGVGGGPIAGCLLLTGPR
ncbi:MAG: OB-fold domain-containing protein [Acidobacteriota bacterium]|nr:OB-fold domain-containing protein [Acidobacteriota bacterium]